MAFSESNINLNKPFLFIKNGTDDPINLGFLKDVSSAGGDEISKIEMANSDFDLKPYVSKSSFELTANLGEAVDPDIISLIENSDWLTADSNLLPIKANKTVHYVSVQLIVPKMDDSTKCAEGYYIPRAILTPVYDQTYDGAGPVLAQIKIVPDVVKGTATAGIENELVMFFRIKNGATVDLKADGTGYDPSDDNWATLETYWTTT